jgi:acyl-homoserine-lactone acylase
MTARRLRSHAFAIAIVCCGVATAGSVEVSRTSYGVVHVKARDYAGLGYGFGYAHATDNLCLMAKHLVTVNGEQSKFFGVAGDAASNLSSDFYARYYYGVDASVRQRFEGTSPAAKALIHGYVAGYNSYLSNTPVAKRPLECRDALWLRPMTIDDMLRMIQEKNALVSGNKLSRALVAATPPGRSTPSTGEVHAALVDEEISQYGSNGWAFGRDTTSNGRGLLFGNPHFPWQGDNRFYQVHLTIPGEIDVMGATIPPLPVVGIGFNKDVGWTHTVSNAKRFTLFELVLDPVNAERYVVDGKSLAMKPVSVSIEVREPDGALTARTHVFYETIYGPVMVLPTEGLVWSAGKAYALADVNSNNAGQIDTWLAIGKARNVKEVKAAAAARVELPWINTLAADRHGDALYADISRMPNVSTALLRSCQPSAAAAALATSKDLLVLDGSQASCNWISASSLPDQAFMPAAKLPSVIRSDYVANSNDSYWLVNARLRLSATSPINGPVAVEQGLRTRIGLLDIEQRLAGKDDQPGNKVSAESVRRMLFSNRNYAAMLALDDVSKLCAAKPIASARGQTVDLVQACSVLANWDRRDNLGSRGAALFREFWFSAEKIPDLYAVKFDPQDPIHTPRQLNIGNQEVATRLRNSLGEAVLLLADKGFAIDTPLGDLQGVVRNGRKIGVSGADGGLGVLNAMRSKPLSTAGYEPVHGTSYVQIVTFDAQGPIVDAVLAYDQSLDPTSPYYSAQTELFSRDELYRLPYTAEQIRADPGYRRVDLPDDPVLHATSDRAR